MPGALKSLVTRVVLSQNGSDSDSYATLQGFTGGKLFRRKSSNDFVVTVTFFLWFLAERGLEPRGGPGGISSSADLCRVQWPASASAANSSCLHKLTGLMGESGGGVVPSAIGRYNLNCHPKDIQQNHTFLQYNHANDGFITKMQ